MRLWCIKDKRTPGAGSSHHKALTGTFSFKISSPTWLKHKWAKGKQQEVR